MTTTGKNRLAFSTRAIHAGQSHDPTTGAVMMPIYATSTYAQESPGVHKGFEYARSQNPTRFAFERCIADLESGTRGLRLRLRPGGDRAPCWSCSTPAPTSSPPTTSTAARFRLFERVRKRSAGLRVSYVDFTDLAAVEAAIRPETKMLWVETPTNPLLKLVDLEAIAALAQAQRPDLGRRQHLRQPLCPAAAGARLRHRRALDHQVPQRPLRHGRRRRWSSATTRSSRDQLKFLQNAVGAISGPFDSFLALRGLKTLALRMERHCDERR